MIIHSCSAWPPGEFIHSRGDPGMGQESIAKIAEVLSTPQIEQFYIPLLKRLSQGEWFTSCTSSAALYPPVYNKVSWSIQEDLRKGFAALGADDTPMVRCAAAKWLRPFVKNLSKQHVLSGGLPIYRRLQSDDQDFVHLLTVEDLIVIAKQLTPPELTEVIGTELVREELIGQYVQLLKDNEAEVRTAAAGQIPGFSKLLEKEVILARIVPCVRDLSHNASQHVRATLANHTISGLAPLLGREATIEHLLPLFLHL
ncbi:armadillo-type protein [Suillus fuscotomentosus]|uniref:Armadillo-type protein n=1 Tax=Suillus fuscotomentosus TaxID=1912939 RepID=A0AAD4DTD0_9AGAM|nr:armadillo-type protein [Suillus fuscotomentosus]KAG1893424.1 armadillo-type protein [Suillus fuscotomentosus]